MQSAIELIGWPEIIGILVILAVMLGAKHIPELFKGLGHGMQEFIKATRQVDREVADVWKTKAAEDDGEAPLRYGIKFWLIVALGVAGMCGAAIALRELFQ